MSRARPHLVPSPPPPKVSEVELHRRWWAQQDQAAVAELWRRHQRVAVHLAARLLHRAPDPNSMALGICDEAFVKALRTFQPGRAATVERPFRAWFLHLVRSAAIDSARKRQIATEPESEVGTWNDVSEQLETQQQLELARAWVLEHFLPSDWHAITLSAQGWSWQDVAKRCTVTVDGRVEFPLGSCEVGASPVLHMTRRSLQMSPRLRLRVIGTQLPTGRDAQPGLALERAKAVVADLCRETPSLTARLEALGREHAGTPSVSFEVVEGGQRTAAAQRVRTQTILARYRSGRSR